VQRTIEIDVNALKAGDPRQNIVVRNRDQIVVPVDTGVFYLMGQVNRPGVFGLNDREVTLKQALGAIGGGFAPLAWPSRCEIIRREKGTDKQITMTVDVDRIFAGLEPDIVLQDDDLVNVGTHTLAPFLFVIRNSFRFTYGFGFVYDRNFADKDAYTARLNPEIVEQNRRAQRGLPF
jgi:protein involved in polysaccharide export with SLBB domain